MYFYCKFRETEDPVVRRYEDSQVSDEMIDKWDRNPYIAYCFVNGDDVNTNELIWVNGILFTTMKSACERFGTAPGPLNDAINNGHVYKCKQSNKDLWCYYLRDLTYDDIYFYDNPSERVWK